jgi:hypothetical protein
MRMNRIQGNAKTGISSLSLIGKLGVNYRTAIIAAVCLLLCCDRGELHSSASGR